MRASERYAHNTVVGLFVTVAMPSHQGILGDIHHKSGNYLQQTI